MTVPPVTEKRCPTCEQVKPASEFNRDKSRSSGLASTCRPCNRARSKAWYRENTDRHTVSRQALSEEQKAHNRARQADWRRSNAARKAEADRRWREANPERFRDNRANWRHLNREALYASQRSRKQVLYAGRKKVRLDDIWVRDKGVCQLCRKQIDRSLVWPHPGALTLDHVVPISRGGLHVPENVQLACNFCNIQKGDQVAS